MERGRRASSCGPAGTAARTVAAEHRLSVGGLLSQPVRWPRRPGATVSKGTGAVTRKREQRAIRTRCGAPALTRRLGASRWRRDGGQHAAVSIACSASSARSRCGRSIGARCGRCRQARGAGWSGWGRCRPSSGPGRAHEHRRHHGGGGACGHSCPRGGGAPVPGRTISRPVRRERRRALSCRSRQRWRSGRHRRKSELSCTRPAPREPRSPWPRQGLRRDCDTPATSTGGRPGRGQSVPSTRITRRIPEISIARWTWGRGLITVTSADS